MITYHLLLSTDKKKLTKMKQIKILSVNISENKGTIKHSVPEIIINYLGVENDAHAGFWHRQVSMLASESIKSFEGDLGREIKFGEFGENITTEGMLLYNCNPLDRFISGNTILEVTQIGKKCHGDGCEIFRKVGNCVMPKEGIFCRVISSGILKPYDILEFYPKTYKIGVITLSDRASKGVYEDLSGAAIIKKISEFYSNQNKEFEVYSKIIPDEETILKSEIEKLCNENYDIIITTGGTGISKRDITPDVLSKLFDKDIPGIMDAIRLKFGVEKPQALTSRSIAGVKDNTLIFVLPGSVKAVNEYMNEITKHFNHLILMINNIDSH